MTPPGQNRHADALRRAIEADDFSFAQAAIGNYFTWFHSAQRSLAEVAEAKQLYTWGMEAAGARKARLADSLARAINVFSRYRPAPVRHTWHVTG